MGQPGKNYAEIRIDGADPQFGGKGACVGFQVTAKQANSEEKIQKANNYVKNSDKVFFVNRDTTVGTDFKGNYIDIFAKFDHDGIKKIGMGVVTKDPPNLAKRILYGLFVRYVPFFYSRMAGVAAGAPPEAEGLTPRIKRAFSGVVNMFSPTVKIRFLPEKLKDHFEDDPLLMGSALRTTKAIGTEYLGIKGIFIQGSQGDLLQRMKNHPTKTLWGLSRLVNPIGIVLLLSFGVYKASRQLSEMRFRRSAGLAV